MKVLVTGANGFVGRYLIDLLAGYSGDSIVAVGGPTIPSSFGEDEFVSLNKTVIWDTVDLLDEKSVEDLIHRHHPNQVYHLAGIAVTHGVPIDDYHKVNVTGTYTLAKKVLEGCGPRTKFLFVSSASAYGHSDNGQVLAEEQVLKPRNAYGASKACAENLLWTLSFRGLSLKIVRPFNHTGPGQRPGFVVPDLIEQLYKQREKIRRDEKIFLQVGPLDSVRDFTDVRDVVKAYYNVMNYGSSGQIYNVASGQTYSIRDVIDIICNAINIRSVELQPNYNYGKRDRDVLIGSNVKLHQLNWHAIYSLEQTVRDMWEYRLTH